MSPEPAGLVLRGLLLMLLIDMPGWNGMSPEKLIGKTGLELVDSVQHPTAGDLLCEFAATQKLNCLPWPNGSS